MTATTSENKDTPLHGPNLILDVENFGPIAEAKNIEFKPMTVFVGPSNTGKTYLAILTHALLRARNEGVPAQSNLAPIRELGFSVIEQDSLQIFASELQRIIRRVHPSSQPESFNTTLWIGVNGFSNESRDFLQKHIDNNVRLTSARYKVLVQEYFEVDSIEMLSNFSTIDNNSPSIRWTETGGHLRISPDVGVASCDIVDTEFAIALDLENLLRHYSVDEFQEIRRELLSSIGDYVESILDNLVLSHYFPTGRSGIMNGRHVLASHLTARDQNYNLLARDFLSSLVAVRASWRKPIFPSRRSRRIRHSLVTNIKIGHVASVIEESILKGRVHIEETAGLPEFFFRQKQGRVLMTSASSMVTDLAPIVMFLRSFVQVGDLIIIETRSPPPPQSPTTDGRRPSLHGPLRPPSPHHNPQPLHGRATKRLRQRLQTRRKNPKTRTRLGWRLGQRRHLPERRRNRRLQLCIFRGTQRIGRQRDLHGRRVRIRTRRPQRRHS